MAKMTVEIVLQAFSPWRAWGKPYILARCHICKLFTLARAASSAVTRRVALLSQVGLPPQPLAKVEYLRWLRLCHCVACILTAVL